MPAQCEHYIEEVIPVKLIFEHPKFRSMSIYRVELESGVKLLELKKDMKARLRTEEERQEWYFKGVLIPDDMSLSEKGVKANDKVFVKVQQQM